MKYYSLLIFSLILLALSCGEIDESLILKELKQAEYTRKVQPEKIIQWINHKDPKIRLATVETLGRIQDSTRAVLLANRLTDDDPAVRSAAVFALGQLFTRSVENYLVEALKSETDKNIRIKIIEALGKSGSNQNHHTMQDFVESMDADYQIPAALACGMLAYRGYPLYPLAPAFGILVREVKNPEVVWSSVYALYRMGGLSNFDIYSLALSNKDPRAKYFALKGLGNVDLLTKSEQFVNMKGQPQYREFLRKYQSRDYRQKLSDQLQDSTWYVRQTAVEVLGNMEDQSIQGEIVKMLDDPHPYVRVQAIRSLAKYPNWYTRREMRRIYLEATDWRIKGESLAVLALVEPAETLQSVKKDLLQLSWPQNYYAIKALENIETTNEQRPLKEADEATELLMQLAENENAAQKTMVLEVLVNRSRRPSNQFFLDKLESGDMAVATVVASYFSLIKSPKPLEAVQPLINVYKNFSAPRDLEAMEPVIVALDSIGSEEAAPFLEEQLKNPYPSLQEKARRALIHITKNPNIEIPQTEAVYTARWDFPELSPDSLYQITFQTSAGNFTIEIDPEKAPVNTANLVSLVKKNFYNGIYFHRVVPGFVVQAGDPRGDGWGGPGYSVICEYNDLPYERGTVGMALAGKDTGGSQFFITHTPQPQLNGRYTVLGKVISGMDVVDRLMLFDRIEQTTLTKRAKNK